MSRIKKFYRWRLRQVLEQKGVADTEKTIELLMQKHEDVYSLGKACAELKADSPCQPQLTTDPNFLCDEGLGGLARWLRAAGYRADWRPGLDDAAIIRAAQQTQAILVTSDTLMMERGILRDGNVPAVWVPSPLHTEQQLTLVMLELNLKLREARCMNCGGELIQGDKQLLQHRIPPKTFRWVNEYYVCAHCDHLFWKGTHWQKISAQLEKAGVSPL